MRSKKRGMKALNRLLPAMVCAVALAMVVACQSSASRRENSDEPPTGATRRGDSVRIEVGNGPCCLVVTEQGIWVLNRRDRTLQLVDPKTNKATKSVDVGAVEMGLAGDHLFLADTDEGVLSLFDSAKGRQRVIHGFGSRGGHAFHDGTLWLGSSTDGTLARLRPPSTKILKTITIPHVDGYAMMVLTDDSTLWTTTWDGELLKIDLPSKLVVARMWPFPNPTDYVAFAVVDGSIFAVSGGSQSLVRLDPDTGQVLSKRSLDLTGGPGLSVQTDGSLWLIRGPDRIDELDPGTGQVLQTYHVPLTPGHEDELHNGGGLATGFGSVWVGVWPDLQPNGTVIRLNRRPPSR
jgi:streptogramin lyase